MRVTALCRAFRPAGFTTAVLLALGGCATQASRPAEEASPPPVAPAPKVDLKEKVDALLSGYERIPTEEDWRALGPEALLVLEQIAADANALPTRRTRAVASMALVDNPAAEARLKALLADAGVDPQYRSTAAAALAHRLGPQASPSLRPLLEDKNPLLRDAAAKALARAGGEEARKSLEERLQREQDPAVREALQQSLTKLEP